MSATAGAAHAAAIANAIKASGAIVSVDPEDFVAIVSRAEQPLVVVSEGGFFGKSFRYLTSHRGFVFSTKSSTQLQIPGRAEIVQAGKIWIPQ